MSLNDPIAAAMSKMLNKERVGQKECLIKPVSVLLKSVLSVLQENMYIGSFDEIEDGKGNMIKVNLLGSINKCGVIKPRFSIKVHDFEKFEKRFLPAKDFGILIVSTPKGIMTHLKAKENNTGGKLIAYCY